MSLTISLTAPILPSFLLLIASLVPPPFPSPPLLAITDRIPLFEQWLEKLVIFHYDTGVFERHPPFTFNR